MRPYTASACFVDCGMMATSTILEGQQKGAVLMNVDLTRAIRVLLRSGDDPAAIATVLRCRFSDVAAVARQAERIKAHRERLKFARSTRNEVVKFNRRNRLENAEAWLPDAIEAASMAIRTSWPEIDLH